MVRSQYFYSLEKVWLSYLLLAFGCCTGCFIFSVTDGNVACCINQLSTRLVPAQQLRKKDRSSGCTGTHFNILSRRFGHILYNVVTFYQIMLTVFNDIVLMIFSNISRWNFFFKHCLGCCLAGRIEPRDGPVMARGPYVWHHWSTHYFFILKNIKNPFAI